MEFIALFLAVSIVLLVAWWGSRALALALFAATLVASIVTLLECGFAACPDNPTAYELLQRGR
jgi:hypothetical protein